MCMNAKKPSPNYQTINQPGVIIRDPTTFLNELNKKLQQVKKNSDL